MTAHAPIVIHPQLDKLEVLIAVLNRAHYAAARGEALEGHTGRVIANAAYDFFGCDALYDLATEIAAPLGVDAAGNRVLHLEDAS